MTLSAVLEHLSNIVNREVSDADEGNASLDSYELTALAVAVALLTASAPR